MDDVTVVVATFGDDKWRDLAHARAIPSVAALGLPYVHVHGDTLHGARNAGLDQVTTSHVIHLDADDELEAGYMEAMATSSADVRAPAVRYIHTGGNAQTARMPKVSGHYHDCVAECLPWGNWLVVGALARAQLLRDVGGWRDFAWSEDWDVWLRCYLAGASIEAVPAAIYREHVRLGSRNRSASHAVRMAAHRAIATANGVPVP